MTDTDTRTGPLALIIHPDGTARLLNLPEHAATAAAAVSEIVGGPLEAIIGGDADWLAYINEEGKLMDLPVNMQGDALIRTLGWHFRLGDYLVGTAVFLGREGVNEVNVPQYVIDMARTAGVIE